MTPITHILKWGSGEWTSVMLACGHSRRVRRRELFEEQLSIGKVVTCPTCADADAQINQKGQDQ